MSTTSESFVRAARDALLFIETDHDFQVAEMEVPTEVRTPFTFYKITYRRKLSIMRRQFVRLSTAPARLELDLEFGRGWPPKNENSINVFELLEIESPNAEIEFVSGISEGFGDFEKMTDQYAALADVLRNHGARFFANDQSLWDAVRQHRESKTRQRATEDTSRLADAAYSANDWSQAIELFESLGDNRTKLQTARLAFARKRNAK